MRFTEAGASKAGEADPGLSGEMTELMSLLAAGLNDKTIAYDLNISKRTLERRIAELTHALGARTRFQVGWFAALRLPSAGPGLPIVGHYCPEKVGNRRSRAGGNLV